MKKEIEERLIALCIEVKKLMKGFIKDPSERNLADQLIRSSTSAALNYGEVQSAESLKDFIHKCSIVLKELRETSIGLRIIKASNSTNNGMCLDKTINECNHLTAILQKTVNTSKSKLKS
jgi:four helix bundle protein